MGNRTSFKRTWRLYAFIALPLAYILLFKYWPMYGVQIAFKDYNIITGVEASHWVGFKYIIRFIKSPMFFSLMWNTLSLSLYSLIAGFPIPIILALSLNYAAGRGLKKTVQMLSYIPHFISLVVLVGIMQQMMGPRVGVINMVIRALGGEAVDFFAKPELFSSLYVWSGIWQQMGWSSIIYLAALSGVDVQMHEAAIVDGASKLRRIISIDLPSIMPTAVILLIMNFGSIMTLGFEKAFLMQNASNIGASEIIDTYIYKTGLASTIPNFSYSSAIGLFQSVIAFALIIIVNNISKRLSEVSLW